MDAVNIPSLVMILVVKNVFCGSDCFNRVNGIPVYNGNISVTDSCTTCQRWDSLTPHVPKHILSSENSNYCRNPSDYVSLWCYTIDPGIRWDNCSVPECTDNSNQEINTIDCQKTSESATIISPTATNTCTCKCDSRQRFWSQYYYGNLTHQEKTDMVENEKRRIKRELTVLKTNLSSYKRKKISAGDDRNSSKSMGYLGIGLITIVVILIVMADLSNVCSCRGK